MKKTGKISLLCLASLATAICGVCAVGSVRAGADGEKPSISAPNTYRLYVSDALVSARNGKKMTAVKQADALIYCVDGDGDGVTTDATRKVANGSVEGSYFNTYSDRAYAYNAGNIGTTPEGTNNYQTFGSSELYGQAYPGPVQRGGEWVLAEAIDVQDYASISLDVAYKAIEPTGDTEGEYLIYLYGENSDGESVVINKKCAFGVNYWTTGVIEFGEELTSVSRIGVSVLWSTVDNQGSGATGNLLYFSEITVHKRAEAKSEISLTANDMALDFYNGNAMGARFEATALRVYHSNTGYAGNFGVTGGNYCYGTQRMCVGSYVALRFNEPVKTSEYKYFDIELRPRAGGADDKDKNGPWEAETAERFYISVLRSDATSTQSQTTFELSGKGFTLCRIDLTAFADKDGYVNKLLFYYGGNDANRVEEEEKNYSILFGLRDAVLTNYEASEMLVYYLERPTVYENTYKIYMRSSVAFRYQEHIDDTFKAGVFVNGQTVADLEKDGKATIEANGNYLILTADKSLFKLDDTDTVKITQGVTVREGLTTKDEETFIYYHSLDRFELAPSVDMAKKSQISLERVEMGTIDEQNNLYGQNVIENTIFLTFQYTIGLNGNTGHMQVAMEDMTTWNGGSEDYVYELAKQGLIHSCMDLLIVNGKSVREWMKLDYAQGLGDLIRISYMGTWNGGKALRVMAADTSNLQLGAGKDMSVELKAGFSTPMGKYVAKDVYCELSAEEAQEINTLFRIVDKTERPIVNAEGSYQAPAEETEAEGCASVTGGLPAVVIAMLAVCAVVIAKKNKEEAK